MVKKSIGKNYILYLINQLLGVITPFITIPYISRVLHADGIGIVSYVGAINAYFVLIAGLGIGIYGQRELSYLQNNRSERTRIFSSLVVISMISTVLACSVYLIFCMLQNNYNKIFYVFSIQILAAGIDISWLFIAMEDFWVITFRSILLRVLSIASIFIFVSSKEDVFTYAFIICFSGLLGNVVLWMSSKKYIDFSLKRANPQKYIKGVIVLFLPTVAISLYTQMDKIMLGYMTDMYQVGCYEQSMKIIRILLLFVVSLGSVFIPRIGDLLANDKIDDFKSVIKNNMRCVFFLASFIFFELNGEMTRFVPAFFGDGFENVVYITNVLSLNLFLIGINNLTAFQCLIPLKKDSLFTVTIVIGAVVNLVANFFLIPQLGAVGAAWGSVFAEFCVTGLELYLVREILNFTDIIKGSFAYIVSGFVMYMVILYISNRIDDAILAMALSVALGGMIYFVELYLLKDVFFSKVIMRRVISIIKG